MGADWDPEEIASGAKRYDPAAFAALFDAFFEKIRRYAYFHTGDENLADDLASEVFSQALESIDGFTDRGGTIGPWLYGIAKNVVASHFRATAAKRTTPLEEAALVPAVDCPEDDALRNLSCEELYEALSTLSEDQRAILLLRFIEGYDVNTVAKIVGKRPGAVRTQQHRAIATLRARYQQGEDDR